MTTETVVLFNPAISSINVGDEIIADSAKRHLAPLIRDRFVVDVSTHLPLSWGFMRLVRGSHLKFVLGSNLLRGNMMGLFRQWDVTPKSAPLVRGSILVGAGWLKYGDDPNGYTKRLWKYVLSQDRIHSVRDSYTERQVRACGVENVVNTGCPTLWSLSENHCAQIPTTRSDAVVTTVTDYSKDPARDRLMLNTLLENYDEVRVWLQGFRDKEYLETLIDTSRVALVPPTLAGFDAALNDGEPDYMGTRLHAGIRALQHGRRSAIVAIDNRAREMSKDLGLPILNNLTAETLGGWIEGSAPISIALPEENIRLWKSQFQDLA